MKFYSLFTVTLALLAGAGAHAAEPLHLKGRVGLGLGGGVAIPMAHDLFNNLVDTGWFVEGHGDYYLSDALGLELQYHHTNFKNGLPINNIYTLGLNYRLAPTAMFTPVLGIAGGWATSTQVAGLDPGYNNFAAVGKFGLDFAVSQCMVIEAAAQYLWVFSKGRGAFDQQSLLPQLNVTFLFGKPRESSEPMPPLPTPVPAAAPVDGDDDGDGVLNSIDKCPGTPSGMKVNSLGCQMAEKISYTVDVQFAPGKTAIAASYHAEIDKIVDLLKEHSDLKAEIQGYTDNTGNAAKNKKLSEARAKSVRSYIMKQGIAASRLSAKGYGAEDPIADNATAEGRQQNRRVVASIQSK